MRILSLLGVITGEARVLWLGYYNLLMGNACLYCDSCMSEYAVYISALPPLWVWLLLTAVLYYGPVPLHVLRVTRSSHLSPLRSAIYIVYACGVSPFNENSSLPQNFPTAFAILLLLVLVPNPSLLFHSVCVFFSCGFLCLFLSCKKFAVTDVGLRLFSVKRFLYSLNYSSRFTNLRGISWSKKDNYVCCYCSLCLLPQQILWPRDVHG